MLGILSRIVDLNEKELRRLRKIVDQVNSFKPKFVKLSGKEFKKKTEALKSRFKKGENLEKLLPEAFALVYEAAWRVLGLKTHDEQLLAAVALYEGKIAEQKTGEGKTLTAAYSLYLRALEGRGVHLVTVNDYLARVGAGWNAPIYDLLGMSTGIVAQEQKSYIYDPGYSDTSHGDERLEHLKSCTRKEAYQADITYGTNNEFGFDYLRDNMVQDISQEVQRGHYFAVVDEVDQVLIDEARTPLIISAPDSDPTDKYYKFSQLIGQLNADTDFVIDEKAKSATLTEHGILRVEKILGVDNLYERDFEAIHHIENALRAKTLYLKDREYIVKEGEVIIVDEFTGRLMPGRRWSDGLHQAVEAKEKVTIRQESKTLATISFQNYFRMYEVLAGMTGTAVTEADEFKKIYKLDVIAVPTHESVARDDHQDVIYKTARAKYGAIVKEIEDKRKKGQPVLIGTTSVEKNEIVHSFLTRKKIPHNILNAKNHEREATIVADAGKPGAVTLATNMAGRGVDIVLGGAMPDREPGISPEKYKASKKYAAWVKMHELVVGAGGLHVIGTERHESRRIDNQLRGRSGRQGDPGSSRFYLSLEDDLMRIFGGEQIAGIMNRLKIPEDQPIENRLVSKAIEQSQVKVEGFHFDQRKRLVEYDDVANQQREIIYSLRKKILRSKNLKDEILEKLREKVKRDLENGWLESEAKPDYDLIIGSIFEIVPFDDRSRKGVAQSLRKIDDKLKFEEALYKLVEDAHRVREKQIGVEIMRQIEKFAYLGSIDHLWIDHIDHIDGLREGIVLRAYGQRDPLIEFKNEAYGLFERLLDKINEELSRRIFRIGVREAKEPEIPLEATDTNVDNTDMTGLAEKTKQSRIGRNDPCWCGSGKKFKKCHYPMLG